MSPGASFATGLLVLLAVGAYLTLVLPRLGTWTSVGVTAAAALGLMLMAVVLTPWSATTPMFGIVALLAGHGGWWLGRRAHAVRRTATRLHSRLPGREKEPRRRGSPSRASASGAHRRSGGADQPPRPLIADDRPPSVPIPAAGAHSPSAAPAGVPASPPAGGAYERTEALTPVPAGTGELFSTVSPSPNAIPVPRAAGGLALADLQRTSLGRYRIDRAIGRGSMGAVYLGLDPMLGRQVAIKTMALGQEFDGAELQEAKARFFREAETAGRLQHKDIVTVYDVGEEQDLAYIAMEFLKGHDLQRHTQPNQLLPVPVVLRIGSRVADALGYAHSQGVIHRDIKPANVMLHLPTGAVKVTDFGIARVTDASRTRTGMVLGTPSFMSPEHLAGQRVDGRTDLYSLGVMLFQLLTGRLPFQAESMAKLMYQIANEAAPAIRSLRGELPPALGETIARALQKNPADRHPDGATLAAELRAVDSAGDGPLWAGAASGATPADVTEPAPNAVPPAAGTPYDATVRLPPARQGTIPDRERSSAPPCAPDLPAVSTPMEIEFVSATDTGRSRSNNEDSVAVDPGRALAVLADGMGGYNAGEVASSMATGHIQAEFGRWLAEATGGASDADVRRAMTLCVGNANRAIFEAARTNPQQSGMGTTLVMGVFRGDWLWLGHVGDSRGYRLRDGTIRQITRDHSLLQEQIDAGLISPEQAAFSANKNLVTRAVGVEPGVELEINRHEVQAGDIVLLCSDGLSDMIDDEHMARLLREAASLDEAATALVEAANEAGGRDNISVILARARASAGARSWWPFKR